nr:MAG TPA: DNA pilot protein VP2 [Microviridae sp.]
MNPQIGAAIISGGASLLGGLFGGKSNQSEIDKANATNLQIARETNQQQYQMFQEQNSFNERMYNQMQAYNTPAAQMQRYQDAGINPYIAAGNVQTGNVQSSLQSAQAPQLHTAQVAPALGMGDAIQNSFTQIGNVVAQYAQNELALSQAQKNRAEAGWVDRLNGAQFNKMSAETNNLQQQGSLLGLDYKMKSDTLGNYIKLSDLSVLNAEKTNEQLDVITQSARIENSLSNINLGIQSQYGKRMFIAQLSKTLAESFATQASVRQRDAQIAIDRQNANTNAKNAQTNAKNAQTNAAVGGAQINNLIQQAIKTAEETTGIKIDNKTKGQLNRTIIQGLGFDNIDKNNKNKAFWWNFGFDKAEQLSRIGVNGSQMYYNFGAGSEKFTKAASPGHFLLGW